MRGLIEALQFLTIFRFKKTVINIEGIAASKIYFPLIGAFLGLILILVNTTLTGILPQSLLNLLLVGILIILSGGLHLDGLSDTFDALFSGKSKEEMLAIMKDCHKGAFGVTAIIFLILFKVNLLSLLSVTFKNQGLFLMCVLSRYSLNTAISFFPYARQEGKAKVFFEVKDKILFYIPTLLAVILAGFTLKLTGLLISGLVIIFTLITGKFVKNILGGITGDILGAISELNELFVLFLIFILI